MKIFIKALTMTNAIFQKAVSAKKHAHILALGLFFALSVTPSFSQKQKDKDQNKTNELKDKKKKLNEDIKNLNEVLSETKTIKNITMLHVQALNLKIRDREQLIQIINSEIKMINGQIGQKQKEINRKSAELDTLKVRYKKMIYYAYRNREAQSKLMFVFAAENFNQAYERVKYMQEINEKRREHADAIVKKQAELGTQQKELELKIAEKRGLLTSEEQEKINLAKEKGQQEDQLGKFAAKEKEIKEELDQKKKDIASLDKKIKEMIEEIARKAREEAEKERERERIAKENAAKNKPKTNNTKTKNKPDPEPPKNPELTKEAEDLSEDFASNKGKLPWPVTKGVITETFGPHEHPKIRNFEYVNNGVDITTPKGGVARAIFNGEVTGIAAMPDGNGKFLIVRHGSYLTVYTNLVSIYVKPGDKIKVKENIGEIDYNEDKGGTIMNFQIWKGQVKLNPEDWLYKGG
jgi:murein hydrolase activator